MNTDGTIEIAHIRNLSRQSLQIIVAEPEDSTISPLFNASGVVTLAPREVVEIERERIDEAQLSLYFNRRQIQLLYLTRDIDDVTG